MPSSAGGELFLRVPHRIDWSVNMTSNKDSKAAVEIPNTRDHLLEVGLRLIRARGYSSTGVAEILDEAGVPKGSFYHHFASKEVFANEVLKVYVKGEHARVERILREGKGAPLRRLRRYFDEVISVYGQTAAVSGCILGSMSLEMADRSDLMQAFLHHTFSNWQASIGAVLQEAMDRGDLAKSNKPEELASFLLNSYEGALLRSKADRSNKPLETFLHFTFNVLLKG